MFKNVIKVHNQKGNITPVISKILASLDNNAENIIEFEKGTYHFYRAGSTKRMLYSSARCAANVGAVDVIARLPK